MIQAQTVGDPAVSFPPKRDESIVERVRTFIKRFVFIPNEAAYLLLAVWIVATHVHDQFEYSGLLFIHSPEKQSGKTRLLEIMLALVFNCDGIECAPTEASLFRSASGTTQLLDEADGWENVRALQKVINSGFHKTGQVKRCDQQSGGPFLPKIFKTYAPRAIAGIGKQILTDTMKDRTFFIEMTRKRKGEQCERVRGRSFNAEAAGLKNEISEWATAHRLQVAEEYEKASEYPYLKAFADRTVDISEGLAAVLEIAYRDYPDLLEQARRELSEAIGTARSERSEFVEDHETLKAILKHFPEEKIEEQPSVIANRLRPFIPECTELEVGRVLRRYGFEPKSVRKGGESKKCYSIERLKLEEVVDRYA